MHLWKCNQQGAICREAFDVNPYSSCFWLLEVWSHTFLLSICVEDLYFEGKIRRYWYLAGAYWDIEMHKEVREIGINVLILIQIRTVNEYTICIDPSMESKAIVWWGSKYVIVRFFANLYCTVVAQPKAHVKMFAWDIWAKFFIVFTQLVMII